MIKDTKRAGIMILSLTYLFNEFIFESHFIMGFGISLSCVLLLNSMTNFKKHLKRTS